MGALVLAVSSFSSNGAAVRVAMARQREAKRRLLLSVLLVSCSAATLFAAPEFKGAATAPTEPLSLWYRQPAARWTEALAVGNGRLGAMIFGGITRERLQLNEDTLWAGGPYDPVNPQAREALPEVRKLVFDGKYREAARMISARVMSKPLGQLPYQTAGDLILTFPEPAVVENYRRDLNLDTAVATVEYTAQDTKFTRQVFSSPTDQVIVVRLTADKKGAINLTAGLQTPQKATIETEAGHTVVMRGTNGTAQGIKGALNFQVRARVVNHGGNLSATSNTVSVANADSVTILIAAATSYKSYDDVSGNPEAIVKKQIAAAAKAKFDNCSPPTPRNISACFAAWRLIWAAATPCRCRPTSASGNLAPAMTRSLQRCIFNSVATC
jgi:alpha-L-fucosidase 2